MLGGIFFLAFFSNPSGPFLRWVFMFACKSLVIGSSLPRVAQLACHRLRLRLHSACFGFRSGVNHHLEYGHGLAIEVIVYFLLVGRISAGHPLYYRKLIGRP